MPYTAIAIAGPPGVGTTTLCNALPPELAKFFTEDTPWKTHSTGRIVRDSYISLGINQPFDLWWPNLSDGFLHRINDEARRLLVEGRVVVDSRFAIKNAEGLENVLTIFVDASVEIRADRVRGRKEYAGMGTEQIIQALENRKQDEIQKGYRLFGYDYTLAKYDLNLNSEKMNVTQEIEAILTLMKLGENI